MKDTSKPQRKLPEQGRQPARCYAIIDLGTQQGFFQGKPKDPAPEIMIMWEMTKFMVTYKEGEAPSPLTISQKYTYSSGEKAKLPKILKAWGKLPKPITKITPKFLSQYVGQYCMLDIEHNESKKGDGIIYANIGNAGLDVKPYDPSIPKPKPFHEQLFFNMDEFTWDVFNKLPKFVQEIIKKSFEWSKVLQKFPEPINQNNTTAVESGNEAITMASPEDDDAPAF